MEEPSDESIESIDVHELSLDQQQLRDCAFPATKDAFEVIKTLGKGGYGTCYLVRLKQPLDDLVTG